MAPLSVTVTLYSVDTRHRVPRRPTGLRPWPMSLVARREEARGDVEAGAEMVTVKIISDNPRHSEAR